MTKRTTPPSIPLLDPDQAARLLDDVIYQQISSMVDMAMIQTTERVLRQDLAAVGVREADLVRIAKEMIDRAFLRIATEPRIEPGAFAASDRLGRAAIDVGRAAPIETECALCDAFGEVVGNDLSIGHGAGSNGVRRSGAV